MRLYVIVPLDENGKARLLKEATGYKVEFHREIDEAQRKSFFLQSDIVFGNPPPEWVKEATRLRWVQLSSVGFDPYQRISTQAVITNLKGFYSWPCAETAIAGIMSLYRKIDTLTMLKQRRQWIGEPLRHEMSLLQNKNVLVLGAGGIAKVCGQILRAFDCQVSFFARTAPEAKLRTAKAVEECIPQMDIIINCLPGTEDTLGFFNAAMVNSMRSTAVFVNVGRGKTVDEPALVAALQEKRIGGAVLDVYSTEPLPESHPLWACENTILSQHTGGGSVDEHAGRIEIFLSNLRRFNGGEPLENVITPAKGY